MKAPLNRSDPFTISNGSTFSASGGSPTRSVGGGSMERSEQIASEIREAQTLLQQHYIGGPKARLPELTKNALDGMVRALDPHSNFHDASEWKDLLEEQQSGYTGIGATIANFRIAGRVDTYILSTFPGSPAARANLRYGDRIVAINGERVSGIDSDIVRDKIRGAHGSAFRLTVEKAATLSLQTIDIRRGRVPQPSIPDAYLLRPGIGYIELSDGFTYTTADELDAAVAKLKRAGMESLILDLRGNGGGIVDQAVKVAERFLPAGTLILTQRGRSQADNRVWTSSNLVPEHMPLVVIVDENTASASEIVAGAFQDDDRALIVGEKTFGKGLVQSVIDLPAKTGLTLTTARYLTPSGRSIQRDYTQIARYDYFNHKTPSAAVGKAYFEARTVTDRRVFGGDGIQPDEEVKPKVMTDPEIALLDPIFAFSRELVNGRILGHAEYRSLPVQSGHRISSDDLPVSDSLLASFYEFAERRNKGFDTSSARSSAHFVRLQLRYQMIMAFYGSISAGHVLIEDDPQVAKALEVIPNAARLAHAAGIARKSRK